MFLCKQICWIGFTTNVMDGDFLVFIDSFSDVILANVVMMHAFHAGCVTPDDGGLVVIVYWSGQRREQIKVFEQVLHPLDTLFTFVSGLDFSVTRTMTNICFFVAFPDKRATRKEDYVSKNGLCFIDRGDWSDVLG